MKEIKRNTFFKNVKGKIVNYVKIPYELGAISGGALITKGRKNGICFTALTPTNEGCIGITYYNITDYYKVDKTLYQLYRDDNSTLMIKIVETRG